MTDYFIGFFTGIGFAVLVITLAAFIASHTESKDAEEDEHEQGV